MRVKSRVPAGLLDAGISKRDGAVLNAGGIRCDSVLYDFTFDKGAIGTISFGRILPEGAIVSKITSDEITVLTSGGSATLKLVAGSTDLTAATAFDTGFAGIGTLALTDTDGVKLPADSELKLVIATAALTAGKLRLFVQYLMPTDL